MIRLFIAISPPNEIVKQLEQICFGLPGVRWTPPDQFHLTLRFIGDTEGSKFLDIKDSLAQIKSPPFPLTLKNTGFFPPRKSPRVLWVGADQGGKDDLKLLRQKIENRLGQIGIPPEGRKYSPHMTIARIKNCPVNRITSFLEGSSFWQSQPYQVEQFHLYSSILTAKGAIHNLEASFDLY